MKHKRRSLIPKKPARIPSEADFARAEEHSREMSEGFERIEKAILSEFKGRAPLSSLWLFPDSTADYRAYVFYSSESDIATCKGSGTSDQIERALTREFNNWNGSSCAVVFDSHEKVMQKCNGNYWKYLH